jgi:predicted TIM-barrel fold metal-dependent hydrolase
MVGVLHIGNTPATFDGWGDAGWSMEGGTGTAGFLRFANCRRTDAAEIFLAALLFGGACERNPEFTVVLAELWARWLPWFVARIEALSLTDTLGETVAAEMSAAERLRRNVKITPLPGLGDDGMSVIEELPEMLVFSSDFPHNEGNADPIGVYGDALDALEPDTRAHFLGETMRDVFARMGDPLPLRS